MSKFSKVLRVLHPEHRRLSTKKLVEEGVELRRTLKLKDHVGRPLIPDPKRRAPLQEKLEKIRQTLEARKRMKDPHYRTDGRNDWLNDMDDVTWQNERH